MSNTIRIELEQGFEALGMTDNSNTELWGCVYNCQRQPVKGTSGWYRTTDPVEFERRIRRVMALDRHTR